MRGEIDDVTALVEHCLVVGPRILLQTDKSRVDVEHRGKRPQRTRPVEIVLVVGIAGPDQADAQPVVTAEPRVPGFYKACRGWRQIRRSVRNGVQPGFECE